AGNPGPHSRHPRDQEHRMSVRSETARFGRRSFLAGAIAAGAAAGTAAAGGTIVAPAQAASSGSDQVLAFHGVHQAGILTPTPAAAMFLSFDSIASSRAELTELFKTITQRARFLTAGGTPVD